MKLCIGFLAFWVVGFAVVPCGKQSASNAKTVTEKNLASQYLGFWQSEGTTAFGGDSTQIRHKSELEIDNGYLRLTETCQQVSGPPGHFGGTKTVASRLINVVDKNTFRIDDTLLATFTFANSQGKILNCDAQIERGIYKLENRRGKLYLTLNSTTKILNAAY